MSGGSCSGSAALWAGRNPPLAQVPPQERDEKSFSGQKTGLSSSFVCASAQTSLSCLTQAQTILVHESL